MQKTILGALDLLLGRFERLFAFLLGEGFGADWVRIQLRWGVGSSSSLMLHGQTPGRLR